MISLSVEQVKPGMILAEAVYNRDRTKLINRGSVVDDHMLARLRKAGVEKVWISDGNADDDLLYQGPQAAENAQVAETTRRVYDELIKMLQEIRDKVLTVATFDMYRFNKHLERPIEQVMQDYRPFTEMVRLRKTVPTLFEHMVDVCMLTVAAAKMLGKSQYDIQMLAGAALLHDIGKFFIPDSILKKPVLTESEQYQVMNHTVLGHDLLAGIKGVSNIILNVAAQHHERLDGSGYPYGLLGDRIDEFTRLVAIADFYAGIAGGQLSGARFVSYEVAEYLGAQAGIQLDKNMAEVFLNGIVAYPLQSLVRLNTGEVGKVIYQNRNFPSRPVVRVGEVQIDLSKSPTVFVEELIQLEGSNVLR